jgi:CSLREA domain-containing protein
MRNARPIAAALGGLLALGGAGLVTAAAPAAADTVVTTVDDELVVDGDCSLREAIEANNTALPYDACLPSATITLPPGDYPVQFTLDIGTGTTIRGAGAGATTLVCTSVVTCITNASAGGPLVLDGLTMVDTQGAFVRGLMGAGPLTVANSVLDGSDMDAIVYVNNTVNVLDSEIRGYAEVGIVNEFGIVDVEGSVLDAAGTAGISAGAAAVDVERSTIRGHLGHAVLTETGDVDVGSSAIVDNGDHGIVTASGAISVLNSTVADNGGNALHTIAGAMDIAWSTIAGNDGRAFNYSGPGSAHLTGSILANDHENCDNPATSGGFNISDDDWCAIYLTDPTDRHETDPLLAGLGDAGGPTPAMVPMAGSPAIDIGGACPATDQRGQVRPSDGDADGEARCDAGAVEVTGPAAPPEVPAPGGAAGGPVSLLPRDVVVVATPTFTG